MTVQLDPDKHETTALFEVTGGFENQRVFEIGCGDGRLTWRYADHAAQVTAIDPDSEMIARARKDIPPGLRGRVEFHTSELQKYKAITRDRKFDTALLSWSL